MNDRQKKFADAYLECGNATEAARRAGYSTRSANRIAHENLKKPYIADYIRTRLAPREAKQIADADEVLQFLSDVVRGDLRSDMTDVTMGHRIRAGLLLLKYHAVKNPEDKSLQRIDDLIAAIDAAAHEAPAEPATSEENA